MLNNLYIISLVLFSVLSFGLGLFTIVKNPKSSISRLSLAVNIVAGLWTLALIQNLLSDNSTQALFYAKILHIWTVFIAIFFYHFVSIFLYSRNGFFQTSSLILGYFVAVFFIVIIFSGDAIISGVSNNVGFKFWVEAGKYYYLLLLYFWVYYLLALYLLIKGYLKNDGIRKRKIFFILLASMIGFFGGGMNFLPQTLGVYPYGSFIAWLYPVLITYGIFLEEVKLKIR